MSENILWSPCPHATLLDISAIVCICSIGIGLLAAYMETDGYTRWAHTFGVTAFLLLFGSMLLLAMYWIVDPWRC
jgi:hypothetical protein